MFHRDTRVSQIDYQTLETMNPKELRIPPRNPMLGEGKGNFSPAKRPEGSSNNFSDNLTE